MGKEISWDVRRRAEELYVTEGRTFDETAIITGVSVSQLKNWAAEGDWRSARSEYRAALTDIRRKTVKLRKALVEKALESLDPQAVYAVARLESAAAKAQAPGPERAESEDGGPESCELFTVRGPAEAVGVLERILEKKLQLLLVRPGEISLSAIRDVQKSMELTQALKAKYAPEDSGKTGKPLSEELQKAIDEVLVG
jgi:hypothetical protein